MCDDGANGRRQQLHPPARHVVCGTDMVRIGLERNPDGDCELVVFHSGGLSYKAGLGGGVYFHILVGYAALKRVEQVTSRLGKGIQPFDFRLRCCAQPGHDDELVGRQISRRRIDEIDLGIHSIKRVIKGAKHVVVGGGRGPAEPKCIDAG